MRCVVELDDVCGGVRCVVELDDYTFNMHLCQCDLNLRPIIFNNNSQL